MQAEVSGDFIRKVPNAEEERGEILVMGECFGGKKRKGSLADFSSVGFR